MEISHKSIMYSYQMERNTRPFEEILDSGHFGSLWNKLTHCNLSQSCLSLIARQCWC